MEGYAKGLTGPPPAAGRHAAAALGGGTAPTFASAAPSCSPSVLKPTAMSQQTADELRRGLEAVLVRVERLRSPLRFENMTGIAEAAAEWADAAKAAGSAGAAVPPLGSHDDLPAIARCGLPVQLCTNAPWCPQWQLCALGVAECANHYYNVHRRCPSCAGC